MNAKGSVGYPRFLAHQTYCGVPGRARPSRRHARMACNVAGTRILSEKDAPSVRPGDRMDHNDHRVTPSKEPIQELSKQNWEIQIQIATTYPNKCCRPRRSLVLGRPNKFLLVNSGQIVPSPIAASAFASATWNLRSTEHQFDRGY